MSTIDELTELLEKASMQIMMLEAQLTQLKDGPYTYSTVLNHTNSGRIRIASSAGLVEIDSPIFESDAKTLADKARAEKWDSERFKQEVKKLAKKLLKNYPSSTRLLMSKAGLPTDFAEPFEVPGSTSIVKRIFSDGFIELQGSSGNETGPGRLLLPLPSVGPINVGDQIVHDTSQTIITRNLGPPIPPTIFKLEHDLGVTWDDIGGLDEVRRMFHEIFIEPLQNTEIYSRYGFQIPSGCLLCGPPGNGKTLIAKAMATEIGRSRGLEKSGFFSVKGPEILSQWVGAAEQRIRDLFSQARRFASENKTPAVIFIDEAEAVMNKRGSGRSSDVDRTIVPSFLTEMDGLNDSAAPVFILLATNRPELLDPAITREGRIDKKVYIPRPSRAAAAHIFQVHLRKYPLDETCTIDELSELSASYLYDDRHVLFEIRRASGAIEKFCLRSVASGAMIAATVQTATQHALRRDLASKTFSGIRPKDVMDAINETHKHQGNTAHDDAIKEFTASYKDDVTEVVRVPATA